MGTRPKMTIFIGQKKIIEILKNSNKQNCYFWTRPQNDKGGKMRVIIAAAGTAGHINPGLAIANKIKEKQKDSKIIFIGTTRGLENDLVPRAGYELRTINAYGLSKKISIQTLKNNIKTLKGFGEARKIIKEFKPDIVIGTGGYICGAVITAAKKYNIPTLLHESNAFPGKAIKFLSKKADTILVSFKDAIPRIKHAKNVVFTGHIPFSNILAYYRTADVFLCMSEHEGFCVPLIESMYFDVPIVAYASTAIPETLGGSGILLESKEPAAVAEAVNRMVWDQEARNQVLEGQRERLKAFSYEQTKGVLAKIIQSYAGGRDEG